MKLIATRGRLSGIRQKLASGSGAYIGFNCLGQSDLNTLHRNSGAPGSAARLNQGVSAMPERDSRGFARPSGQGTADAVSKR
jgi:hypothetical protein